MTRRSAIAFATVSLFILLLANINFAQKQAPAPAATAKKAVPAPLVNTAAKPPLANVPVGMSVDAEQALVKQYCSGCHNDKMKSGGMSLTQLDLAHPEATPELTEKMIRKLRVGLMPPAGMLCPDAA